MKQETIGRGRVQLSFDKGGQAGEMQDFDGARQTVFILYFVLGGNFGGFNLGPMIGGAAHRAVEGSRGAARKRYVA